MENRVTSGQDIDSSPHPCNNFISPATAASFQEDTPFVLDELSTSSTPLEEETVQDSSHGSHLRLKSPNRSPFRLSIKRRHLYDIFRWSLMIINGLLILFFVVGVFVYFTELYDSKQIKWMSVDEKNVCSDKSQMRTDIQLKTGPRYAWVISMIIFALLLVVPCVGFFGALFENNCMLILYGSIFLVNVITVFVFNPPWSLVPAYISAASFGLVFLIRQRRRLFTLQLPVKYT